MSEHDLTGFHRAEVISNTDHEAMARVKVRVQPFFDGIPPDDLPWAAPAFPVHWTLIPAEGSWVWVFFEANDPLKPVYFAEAPGKPQLTHADANKITLQSPGGHKIELDDDAKTLTVEHLEWPTGGYRMELSGTSMKISMAPGVTMEITGADIFPMAGVVQGGIPVPAPGVPMPGSIILKVGATLPGG